MEPTTESSSIIDSFPRYIIEPAKNSTNPKNNRILCGPAIPGLFEKLLDSWALPSNPIEDPYRGISWMYFGSQPSELQKKTDYTKHLLLLNLAMKIVFENKKDLPHIIIIDNYIKDLRRSLQFAILNGIEDDDDVLLFSQLLDIMVFHFIKAKRRAVEIIETSF